MRSSRPWHFSLICDIAEQIDRKGAGQHGMVPDGSKSKMGIMAVPFALTPITSNMVPNRSQLWLSPV